MKMVKSLLLGSAASVVAVAGAQAADLPVKAKAVEYVKICSLYGAGFYYIPGTDICMKVGGYVRAEYFYNFGSSGTTGIYNTSPSGQQDRIDGHDFLMRSRAYASFDTRQQTQYGTLRSYLNIGLNYDSPAAAAFSGNRAFIQFAGLTMGLATSYYDFYCGACTSYLQLWTSDTGDGGWKVFAYTAQFGGGFSATISAEEPRRTSVWNVSSASNNTAAAVLTSPFAINSQTLFGPGAYLVGTLPTADQIKIRFPDIVANIRLDQTWGGFQVMGALHDAGGGYYGNSTATSAIGNWNNGHPSEKYGYAVGVGAKLNLPMFGPGDYVQAQFNYAQGATRYTGQTPFAASPALFNGNSMGLGIVSDGVFCGASAATGIPAATGGCPSSGVELTTAWGINAAWEHFWTPALRTSLYYGYNKITYNANAQAMITSAISANTTGVCATTNTATSTTVGTATPIVPAGGITNLSNCNANWSYWALGSRTQWNVTKDFYFGVDVMYSKLQTAFSGTGLYRGAVNTGAPSATYSISDQSNWAFRFRVHRDIVP